MGATKAEQDLVTFAERILALLDQGAFVATYKYAVLLALMDLCLEGTNRQGHAPDSVTTRQLAEKVVQLYWPHTAQFRGRTLRQNSGRRARILTDIGAFRASLPDPSVSLERARRERPDGFGRLIDQVEWTLILMPLPRLQVVGRHAERLLYDIAWGLDVGRSRAVVRRYQETRTGFDNEIRLYPNVGEYLVTLSGLLRPLIHRGWAAMVARLNDLDDTKLDAFLFGADRTTLAAVRPGLVELQDGRCFYCRGRLGRLPHVDHFIPFARSQNNAMENLVAADDRCNGAKRDFLAATAHVAAWRERNRDNERALVQLAGEATWETHAEETLGVARGIYLRLHPQARLWVRGQDFCGPDVDGLRRALE